LCNHAGLGLGRHAMNLKELHLGPRPRAAAAPASTHTTRGPSFCRAGNVPEASVKTLKLKIPRIPIPPHTSARENPKSGIYHPNTGKTKTLATHATVGRLRATRPRSRY
jgi:hypothetical protein